MPFLPVSAGRQIYWEEHGVGPCLVLLNGMSQATGSWTSHVRPLAEQLRVVLYDARGQGRSPLGDPTSEPVSLDQHVDDLHHVLDAVGAPTAHLCGFSHGARLALAYAARHPNRVEKLALTSIGDGEDALRRTIVRSWVEVLARGGVEAMAWASLPDTVGRDFLAANEKFLDAIIRATLRRNSAPALAELLRSMAGFPPAEVDAARVEADCLLISSRDDHLVSPDSAERLAARFRRCRHVWVAPSGHTIPVEAPGAWREAVTTFLLET